MGIRSRRPHRAQHAQTWRIHNMLTGFVTKSPFDATTSRTWACHTQLRQNDSVRPVPVHQNFHQGFDFCSTMFWSDINGIPVSMRPSLRTRIIVGSYCTPCCSKSIRPKAIVGAVSENHHRLGGSVSRKRNQFGAPRWEEEKVERRPRRAVEDISVSSQLSPLSSLFAAGESG